MGEHPLYVRFPDGIIRYGLYQSTADVAYPDLVDTFEASQQPEYHANRRRWDEAPEGPGRPVDVATVYGGGFAWRGTATEDFITSGCDPWEDGRQRTDGTPAWVSDLADEGEGTAHTPARTCGAKSWPLGTYACDRTAGHDGDHGAGTAVRYQWPQYAVVEPSAGGHATRTADYVRDVLTNPVATETDMRGAALAATFETHPDHDLAWRPE